MDFNCKKAGKRSVSPISGQKCHIHLCDLAVCPDSHGRPPDADAGGNDTGHIAKDELAAGIFPADPGRDIAGEELAVVCMTGEDEIGIRGCELGKLGWLVVDHDYRA